MGVGFTVEFLVFLQNERNGCRGFKGRKWTPLVHGLFIRWGLWKLMLMGLFILFFSAKPCQPAHKLNQKRYKLENQQH